MKINSVVFGIIYLAIISMSTGLFAQSSSQYDVRFQFQHHFSGCGEVYVDLEVKAKDGQPPFFLAEQNYRFSFLRDELANPRIFEELEISGTSFSSDHTAFFNPHTLTGSTDTIVSYNVELGGGTGYPIDDSRWYKVGQLVFDVVEPNVCYSLIWHTKAPADFPPTSIVEKYGGSNGSLFAVDEGGYSQGIVGCAYCVPIEMASFEGEDLGCATELKWTTETETNNELFLVEKSNDGLRWFTIAKMAGAGTTIDPKDYTFVDENITSPSAYYRIKQIDFDGQYSISSSINIRSSCYNDEIAIGITQLFPNPVESDEYVNIEFYTNNIEMAELTVTDELGRVILHKNQELIEGRNLIAFKAESLAAGVYFVQIKGSNWYSSVRKLVKL